MTSEPVPAVVGMAMTGSVGSGNFEFAVVVLKPAAAAEQQRGAFRHVQAASAAQPDNDVRSERAGLVHTDGNRFQRDIGLHAVVDEDNQ